MNFREFFEATRFGLTVPNEVPSNDYVGYKYSSSGKQHWAGHGNSAVGILPVAMKSGLIGVAWRKGGVDSGNCYGAIGGATEATEGNDFHSNLTDTIKQELREEAGYTGPILNLQHLYTYFDHPYEKYFEVFKYYTFVGMVEEPFKSNPEEDSKWESGIIKWVPFEKLNNLKLHPGLKEVLNKASNNLKSYVEKAKLIK